MENLNKQSQKVFIYKSRLEAYQFANKKLKDR